MIINDRDQERLDNFLKRFFEFLESKKTNTVYVKESKHNPANLIELIDGLILPAEVEAPFVLDNEFRTFVIENLLEFMQIMHKEAGGKLFGFAERSLYEYLTTWGFLFISEDIDEKHTARLKALLFAGHYKFIEENTRALKTYLEVKGKHFKPRDNEQLNSSGDDIKFFDYQWNVAIGMRNHYGQDRYESFLKTQIGFKRIYSHQSMRVHGNPLSINETVSNNETKARHQLLLAFYARQAMDYFKASDPQEYEKIVYLYEKFIKNNRIKLD
jgi:hypothetical protein